MQLLIALATVPTQSSGTDWKLVLGVPSAVAASVTLMLYVIGVIRPLGVRKPRYWYEGEATKFSCYVKNRSRLYDRTLTAVTLIRLPGPFRRPFRRWRKNPQDATILVWGVQVDGQGSSGNISKNNEASVSGELRPVAGGPALVTLDKAMRIEARAGSKRSRNKKLQLIPADATPDEAGTSGPAAAHVKKTTGAV
ncbi:MAG TPA: hypothetical protein DEV93_07600 [Chloroflexi bacterium]|nr:hypothetical protein [Chloroflexota bacterium]